MTITSYLDGKSSSMIKTVVGFESVNNSQYPKLRKNYANSMADNIVTATTGDSFGTPQTSEDDSIMRLSAK